LNHSDASLIFALFSFGKLAHVDSVANGIKCGCHCPSCGEPVIAVQGDHLAHHFRHVAETECATGFETMAHMLAKQIIAEAKRLRLPSLSVKIDDDEPLCVDEQMADLADVVIEPWKRGLRPDAVASWQDLEIGIEIFVTNECDEDKIARYKQRNLAALEIDLSQFKDVLDPTHFEYAVIEGARRKWLYHPYMNEPARRVERKLLKHNAEIAKSHADSRNDPVGQQLVEEWFKHFWAGA
jgi:hypothetical protein